MYCPPKLTFFIKNVSFNLTSLYIYLYVLILLGNILTSNSYLILCPAIFLHYEWGSDFYYNLLTRSAYKF